MLYREKLRRAKNAGLNLQKCIDTCNEVCRTTLIFDYNRLEKECVGVAQVLDGQTVTHTTEPISVTPGVPRYEISDKARDLAEAFLDKNFPQ